MELRARKASFFPVLFCNYLHKFLLTALHYDAFSLQTLFCKYSLHIIDCIAVNRYAALFHIASAASEREPARPDL